MNPSRTRFYVTGGTVPTEAPSYIPRRADTELYEGLLQGEFCYVLTSRQMGKSSLMVRTAARLRKAEVAVAVLDLTALGQNLKPEQWYDSLLMQIGEQLELEDEVDDFCQKHRAFSPLQRWRLAIREIVLKWRKQPVVIFIDEIDITRSLPFSTDEFFAVLREFYNSRAQEPALNRLTFCLLGVATPSDLIRDTRMTPFNIGRRIELTDFTADEAAPLARGLISRKDAKTRREEGKGKREKGKEENDPQISQIDTDFNAGQEPAGLPVVSEGHVAAGPTAKDFNPSPLLDRILYWTGGHPYLTQRLCHAVAESLASPTAYSLLPTPSLVDHLCAKMYFDAEAENRDDNLAFVRNRLLNNREVELAGLLLLYGQILKGRPVPADDTHAAVSVLRLAGIASREGGLLRPRNRIYARVFDRKWIREHLPDAEVRRQRSAFFRGVLRAAGVLTPAVLIIAALALLAWQQKIRADRFGSNEQEARRAAELFLYVSDMYVAQQAWDGGNAAYTVELLNAHLPKSGEKDLRGFEWRYLWRQSHQELSTLQGHQGIVFAVAFSPDGKLLASGDGKNVNLWDRTTQEVVAPLPGHTGLVKCAAFSPDGKTLATAGDDKTIRMWDVQTLQSMGVLKDHTRDIHGEILSIAFSRDGRFLVSESRNPSVRVWDVARRKEIRTLPLPTNHTAIEERSQTLAFSPNGRLMACDMGRGVRLWDTTTWKPVGGDLPISTVASGLAFSHDGRWLSTASRGANSLWNVSLWNVTTHRLLFSFPAHTDEIRSIAFSQDDKALITSSWDSTIKLWDIPSRQLITTLKGHADRITSLSLSPDGKILASSGGSEIKLWDIDQLRQVPTWKAGNLLTFCFLSNHQLFTWGSYTETRLWDVATHLQIPLPIEHPKAVSWVACSSNGKTVAAVGSQAITVWDLARHRETGSLPKLSPDSVRCLALSPDGSLLATAEQYKNKSGQTIQATVRLWNSATLRQVGAPLLPSTDPLLAVAFAPDGKTLAIADDSHQNRITLWDVGTHQQIGAPMTKHTGSIGPLAFSPDGRMLASCSWDRTVRLWDVTSQQEIATLKGHQGSVTAVAFSPDGKTLASASRDKTVRLWSIAAKREIATFRGSSPVNSVGFSADGNLLASADHDGFVHLWYAEPDNQTGGSQSGNNIHRHTPATEATASMPGLR